MAPGFIAIGSGPAGLSAAETFRSKHPHISVRILTTHVPWCRGGAQSPLVRRCRRPADGRPQRRSAVVIGGGLIGCEAAACLASRGLPTAMVAAEPVPLQRRFGDDVGDRAPKILSDNGFASSGHDRD